MASMDQLKKRIEEANTKMQHATKKRKGAYGQAVASAVPAAEGPGPTAATAAKPDEPKADRKAETQKILQDRKEQQAKERAE